MNIWDIWRMNYDNMTFQDMKEWYEEHYTGQNAWALHYRDFMKAFQYISIKEISIRVIELGCHRGALAHAILERFPIVEWQGYDISRIAIMKTELDATMMVYQAHELHDQFWEYVDISNFNVFVASHMLEHLKWKHVKSVLNHVQSCKYWVIAMPLLKRNWSGYGGTHILEVGWPEIIEYAKSLGHDTILTPVQDLGVFEKI